MSLPVICYNHATKLISLNMPAGDFVVSLYKVGTNIPPVDKVVITLASPDYDAQTIQPGQYEIVFEWTEGAIQKVASRKFKIASPGDPVVFIDDPKPLPIDLPKPWYKNWRWWVLIGVILFIPFILWGCWPKGRTKTTPSTPALADFQSQIDQLRQEMLVGALKRTNEIIAARQAAMSAMEQVQNLQQQVEAMRRSGAATNTNVVTGKTVVSTGAPTGMVVTNITMSAGPSQSRESISLSVTGNNNRVSLVVGDKNRNIGTDRHDKDGNGGTNVFPTIVVTNTTIIVTNTIIMPAPATPITINNSANANSVGSVRQHSDDMDETEPVGLVIGDWSPGPYRGRINVKASTIDPSWTGYVSAGSAPGGYRYKNKTRDYTK